MLLDRMKTRCAFPECRAPLSLVTPECKCKNKYCSKHRAHMDHACAFDYRAEHVKNLLETMSTPILGKKIETF